ncbi:MAG TPA: hypothetical protein VFS26_05095, partial [Solirubrobacterales bacterium]|nr:hypothetical protein [Solirubrobacterales bacterium]
MTTTMVREAWTDERLDDLTKHMDDGFGQVRADLRALRGEMGEVRSQIGTLQGETGEMRGEIGALGKQIEAQGAELGARI